MKTPKNHNAMGVILSLSKHGGQGLSAHTLRRAQGDSALCIIPPVIARNEATAELCQSGTGYIFLSKMPLWVAFVFCLFPSANASAQSRDSAKKDTSRILIIKEAPMLSRKQTALIVVNGKIYRKNIKNIDPKTILNISILKGKEAEALYGSKGANGVVIITTKQ